MHRVGVQEAVASIARSDRPMLAELYVAHSTEARRLAFLLTGSREAADDLTQEAFIRAFGRLAHLRERTAFLPYLRKTIVNLARMQFRRSKVERRYLAGQRAESTLMGDVAAHGSDDLLIALSKLPYRQRVALILRFYVDLPDAASAELMGCAVGTVRSLVSRGIAGLRESLGGNSIG